MASVIRYIGGTKKSPKGTLYLQCHVKPGASKMREGITAVTDDAVEICVSAQAREGEANKAVIELLCKDWHQTLKLPKSSFQISRGAKSRDKTVAIMGIDEAGDKTEEFLSRVKTLLLDASDTGT